MDRLRDWLKRRPGKKELCQEISSPPTYSGWFSIATADVESDPTKPTRRSHIILVHGIGGHWKDSWECEGFSWIQNFLKPDLEREHLPADVWSYGYDSRTSSNTVATVEDVALLLLSWMHARRLAGPIIFVAHSLGGLVVKKAIIMAHSQNVRFGDLLNSIRGCVFLGVPHRGADNNWWMTFPAKIIRVSTIGFRGNAQFAESIERTSQVWREISSSFIPRAAALIATHSFFETRRTGPTVLVDTESAVMGLENEIPYPTDSDHVNINKFGRNEHMRYILVGAAIIELLTRAQAEMEPTQGSTIPPQPRPSESSSSRSGKSNTRPALVLLLIADDGTFVRGDEDVAGRLVVEIWPCPANERTVRITATALEDESYRKNFLNAYLELKERVQLFQDAVNFLVQERVRFRWEWQASNLANAILHLRSLALPGLGERETWFAWPLGEASKALKVYFSRDIGNSVRSGYYDDRSVDRRRGMPPDSPIWLQSVFPYIAWERVAPAAALQAVKAVQNPEQRVDVDLSDWVLSDHPPSELERDTPAYQKWG